MKSLIRQTQAKRKAFIKANKAKSFTVVEGKRRVLISAPHGVWQVRLGKGKWPEAGSLAIALYVAEKTESFLIAKTKCDFDDANFDDPSDYKNEVYRLIAENRIKYVIDFHGLAHNRGIDVNLGTHIGKNVEVNKRLFNSLKADLEKEFVVSVDNPFMGSVRTVSSSVKNTFPEIWSLQIEVDWEITDKKKNVERFKRLTEILISFINLLW